MLRLNTVHTYSPLCETAVTMGLIVSMVMLSNNVDLFRLTQWYSYRGAVLCMYGVVSFCLGFFLPDNLYYNSWCVPAPEGPSIRGAADAMSCGPLRCLGGHG